MKIKEYRKFQIGCQYCETVEDIETLIDIHHGSVYDIKLKIKKLLPIEWEIIIVQKSPLASLPDLIGFKCPNCKKTQ